MTALVSNTLLRVRRTCWEFARIVTIVALAANFLNAQTISNLSVAFLFPISANAGDAGFAMTLTGQGFAPGSAVRFGGQMLATTYLTANQLTAVVTPEQLTTPGQVAVYVTNPTGATSNALTFTINAAPIAVTTTTLPAAAAGVAYSQTLAASGGTAPYTWTFDTLPPGLTLTPAGQLLGTPSARGAFTFTVTVRDANQRVGTRVLTLSVTAPAITITTNTTLPPGTEGVPYTQTLSSANGTAPVRWSSTGALPPGLTLEPTGILRGTPTARGAYTLAIQATDSANATASATFNLTVQAATLAITTISPLFSGAAGSTYSQTFAGTGGVPPYSWSSTPDVPGLALDRVNGVLSGTPQQAGTYNLTVQLTDSTGVSTSKPFALVIEQPQLRITNSSPLPSGAVTSPYQQRFLASGGRPPYTWAITSGSLPGVLLDASTGILSGTATASGTFDITVTVRDAAAVAVSRNFSVTIAPGPLRLTGFPEALQATAGEPISITVAAAGGTPPYVWAVNGLPEGLEIDSNGVITGAPRVPGSFLFTVRVSDADRATATELVALEVKAPVVPALTISGLPAVSQAATQHSFRLQLASPYTLPLSGQLMLSFAADAGTADPAVQFSTGGRTLDFRIPAGSTDTELPLDAVGVQTGTVAGTMTFLMRLQTPGATITPTPVTLQSVRIERSAPAITSATFTRTSSGIEVRVTGYSTAREITQGVFRFRAAAGASLGSTELTLPLEDAFGRWFRDNESTQYGGQFTFTQQFAIQGDVAAVTPVSVTLTNRIGSATADVR